MKMDKLLEKYTPEELAESFVFRTKLTAKEKEESNIQLSEMRRKIQKEMSPKERLLGRLLQLKYQMEDYSNGILHDTNLSFSFFLKEYLKSLDKKNKDFAAELDINETELSQILNKHRLPSEKLMIQLEIHSNKIIPAITWFRLLEKEKELK